MNKIAKMYHYEVGLRLSFLDVGYQRRQKPHGKYQGRKLDYDCKKRQQQSKGQVPDKEIKQVAILVMVMEIIFSCWPKSVQILPEVDHILPLAFREFPPSPRGQKLEKAKYIHCDNYSSCACHGHHHDHCHQYRSHGHGHHCPSHDYHQRRQRTSLRSLCTLHRWGCSTSWKTMSSRCLW